ncbi:MAG: ClC family H(+)/Cl(-) exchange transporter [Sarcina sp.]
MGNGQINNMLSHRKNLKYRLIFEGAVVGIIAGIVIVIYRAIIDMLLPRFAELYHWAKADPMRMVIVFAVLCALGAIVGFMVRIEPMISGSGIPQVEGDLSRNLKMNWWKILIFKFLGGIIGLGAGLSVGKEGPSVQMGASVGKGFSKIFKRINIEEKFLITAGAAAGLSSAFNAPLSGAMFALEEVHRNFSPLVLISAMTASVASDFILRLCLHPGRALDFQSPLGVLPLKYYWVLIILGVIMGVGGLIFNKGILKIQSYYGKFKKVPVEVKVMVPFVMTGIAGMVAPILLGGGHSLIISLPSVNYGVAVLLVMLAVKFLLTLFSFGSGLPGGIFFPLLVLGAIVGNVFGIVACKTFHIPEVYIMNFIILAMAANFAATVKAPITGMVLIMEMTGSFEQLLSLSVVVICAYMTSEALKTEPIYESLLDKLLNRVGHKDKDIVATNKILIEHSVELGSSIEGKLIKDIQLPSCCLVVAIKRGDIEIIPRGNTKILAGDYLIVMASEQKSTDVFDLLEKTSVSEIKEYDEKKK